MKPSFFKIFPAAALLSVAFLMSGCDKDDAATPLPPTVPAPFVPEQAFVGLRAGNSIIRYNTNNISNTTTVSITGLGAGENILAIDYRPSTGQLYGVTNQSRLYFINGTTGTATVVGAAAFAPAINGTVTGFDFNPTVDLIRLHTSSGQNLRLNPVTGVAITDTPLPVGTNFGGAGYSNNIAGNTATTLFSIDIANSKLVRFTDPNGGVFADVAPLGVTATAGGEFDINPDNTVAIAQLTVGGQNGLYLINTVNGTAVRLQTLTTPLIGIAVPTNPVGYATTPTSLVIFNLTNTAGAFTKTLTGLGVGESIRGIDFRPATGQLFALGSTGQVYTLNLATGAATATAGAPVTLAGTSFGFDWNPTVDRIRVVSNTGKNMRLLPDGSLAAMDTDLSPGTPAVSATAYSTSTPGLPFPATTTMYVIDHNTDRLYSLASPNTGVLTDIAPLGINVVDANGFDIGPTSNTAFAVMQIGTAVPNLYRINLTTGASTLVGAMPTGTTAVNGFSAGPGF